MATTQEIRACLQAHGYEEDRFGHMKKTFPAAAGVPEKTQRYKFGKQLLRREVLCRHADGTCSWVRLASTYYKNICVVKDARGMSYLTGFRG